HLRSRPRLAWPGCGPRPPSVRSADRAALLSGSRWSSLPLWRIPRVWQFRDTGRLAANAWIRPAISGAAKRDPVATARSDGTVVALRLPLADAGGAGGRRDPGSRGYQLRAGASGDDRGIKGNARLQDGRHG